MQRVTGCLTSYRAWLVLITNVLFCHLDIRPTLNLQLSKQSGALSACYSSLYNHSKYNCFFKSSVFKTCLSFLTFISFMTTCYTGMVKDQGLCTLSECLGGWSWAELGTAFWTSLLWGRGSSHNAFSHQFSCHPWDGDGGNCRAQSQSWG